MLVHSQTITALGRMAVLHAHVGDCADKRNYGVLPQPPKATIHQLTTMQSTSKMYYFPVITTC